jgi:hypothetical protein
MSRYPDPGSEDFSSIALFAFWREGWPAVISATWNAPANESQLAKGIPL